MYQILAVVAFMLFILAAPPYIIDTLKGKTKPERASWLIYSVLNLTAFIANISLGAHWSLVFLGLDTLGSLIVLVLSLKYGVDGWTRLDRAALVIAGIGVTASIVARQPVIALLGAVGADLSGTLLTIRKTFRNPGSETTVSWLLTGSGALCGVLSVGQFNIALLLYPVYLVFANYAVPVTQVAAHALHRNARRGRT